MKLLILICLINCVFSSEEMFPRILIIGSGPSGIATASKLLQNGFKNLTILEAENRIGGRVHSIKMGKIFYVSKDKFIIIFLISFVF